MSFEEELKRLTEEKPELDSEKISHLQELLDAFCQCHRFGLMGTVHLARFFDAPDEVPLVLTSLTAANFVEQGSLEIVSHKEVLPEHVDQLIYIFEGLLEGVEEASPQSEELITSPVGVQSEDRERPTYQAPVYGSIEAERKLHEAQSTLVSLSHFSQIKKQKIGLYWDHSIIRAPFLEDLSLEDFAEIQIEHLLKKKNVGNVKIHALLMALDRVFEGSPEQQELQVDSPLKRVTQADPVWKNFSPSIPQSLRGFLADFEQSALAFGESDRPIVKLWKALPSLLAPQEFLALWLAQEHGSQELVQEQLSLNAQEYETLCRQANEKLCDYLEEHLAFQRKTWEEQLRGPGASESSLLLPYLVHGEQQELQRLLGRVTLFAIGARHPSFREHEFKKHWTFAPDALSFAVESILDGEGQIERKKLEVLLPQFCADELLQLIKDA